MWPTPAILGHEAAGIVEKVGKQVTYVKPGDHVIACLSVFCGYCPRLHVGSSEPLLEQGRHAARGGDKPRLSQDGKTVNQFADLSSYAEQMLVHENALVKIGETSRSIAPR